MQKSETKASTQIQSLQGELLSVQREVYAFKSESQRKDSEVEALQSSRGAYEAESEQAKWRLAATADSLAKSQAEVKKLHGYVKQLEATQRVKDAQARTFCVFIARPPRWLPQSIECSYNRTVHESCTALPGVH